MRGCGSHLVATRGDIVACKQWQSGKLENCVLSDFSELLHKFRVLPLELHVH